MQGAGSLKAGLLANNKGKLRQARQHARELSLAINGTKRQIDALKAAEEVVAAEQVACLSAPPRALCLTNSPNSATAPLQLCCRFNPCRGLVRFFLCMARTPVMGHEATQKQTVCMLFLCLAGLAAMGRSAMQMRKSSR